MAIPKPTDLTCRHQAAWAYITVPTKRGHSQTVEYDDRDTWRGAALVDGEWLVPMYQAGDTVFRARYTRADDYSPWTNGRVWMPDGFAYDDSASERPAQPYRLRNRWSSAGDVELSWSQDGMVDGWHVRLIQQGREHFDALVGEPYVEVSGLNYAERVDVDIRALVGAVESEPLLQEYPDFNYRPTTPRALRVVASDTMLDLAWLQDDMCEEWQVMWRRSDLGLIREPVSDWTPREGTGNVLVSGDPEYIITGLEPDTEYSLLIAARWRRSSYSAESLVANYATTGGALRKPRPRQGRVTATSIELLWDDDPAATGWVVRRTPGHSRHWPTGQPRWLADGLEPETSYEFGVIAVDDDYGLESEEATITVTTTGDVPPPVDPPSAPSRLRVHCIHPTRANVEWDGNADEERVTHYLVEVVGVTEKTVIGTLQELHGLEPETDYVVRVRACRDDVCSRAAEVAFRTGAAAPPPEPDPPSGVPTPTGLYLDPVGPGVVHASWDRPADARTWWLVSIDGRTWSRVTSPSARLVAPPGVERTVEVYAVIDGGSGSATKLSAITSAAVVTPKKGA